MAESLEELVIRLVGDNSDLKRALDETVRQTEQAERDVDNAMGGMADASKDVERAQEDVAKTVGQTGREMKKAANGVEYYIDANGRARRANGRFISTAEATAMGIKKVEGRFRSAARAAQAYGGKIRNVGLGMTAVGGGMTFGLTMPIVGVGLAMAKAGSDAEETRNKFNVVFKDVAKSAAEMTDVLDQSFGMTQGEARKLLSDTGDLLTGFGFTGQQALELSGEVQKLAVDLASFTNVAGGTQQASDALTKALLGEREAAKALGIAIQEEDVKEQVATNTKNGVTFATERQAKAYATLQIAQRQSLNAIGDYARSSDGLANQTRELWGDLKDLAASFGEILLPAVKSVVKFIRSAIARVRAMSDSTKRMILIFGGIVAVAGPVVMAIGTVIAVIGSLVAAISGFMAIGWPAIAAAAALAAKIALIATAATAVVAAIGAMVYYLVGPESLGAAWDYVVATTKKWAMMTIGFLANFKHNLGVLIAWLPKNWDKLFTDIGRIYVTFIKNAIMNSGVFLKALFRIFNTLQGYFFGLFKQIFTVDFLNFVVQGVKKVAAIFVDFASYAWETMKSIFSGDSASIEEFGAQMANDFEKGANTKNILATIGDVAREEMANLRSPLDGFESSIEEAPEFVYDVGQKAGEAMVEGMEEAVDKAAPATEVMDTVTKELLGDIEALEAKLKEQVATFGMAGNAVEIYKLQQRGATEEQLRAVKALDEELKLLEKEEKLKQKAEQLTKKHLTPLQKLTEGQNELNEMLQKGLIDVHTHTEAMRELQKEFDKDIKVKITVEGVDAALAGTAEAEARLREFRAKAMGPLDVAIPDGPVQVAGGGVAAPTAEARVAAAPGTDQNGSTGQVVELLRVIADGITELGEDTISVIQAELSS